MFPRFSAAVLRPIGRSNVTCSAVWSVLARTNNAIAAFSSASKLPDIDASKIKVTKSSQLKPKPAKETLIFGHTFTDHMLEVDYDTSAGWHAPRIVPFGNLSLHPAVSSLHYGLQCFEGMKAYIDSANKIRMFRPDMNMIRMNSSNKRLGMPAFSGDQFTACIKELLKIEKSWIPQGMGYSLYIRPTCISTEPRLGVGPAQHVKLYVILCPVGPYYKEGFNPIKLYADPKNVRAWPGGTGHIKCGGNYAMTIEAQAEAATKGYAQCLWLYGDHQEVTEVGTMNQFFFWKRKGDGKPELVTCPLDGTILPGVTRDSILQLTRSWGQFEVTERHYTIHEVVDAIKEGRMIEAFGAGTAAIVAPVKAIFYNGAEHAVPLDPTDPAAKSGKLAKKLMDSIMEIQYGVKPHPWSVVVD